MHYLFLNGIFFIASANSTFFILLIKQAPQLQWSFIESKIPGTEISVELSNSLPKIALCALLAWSKFKCTKTERKAWEELTFNHLLSRLWDSALFWINYTSSEEFKLLLSLGGIKKNDKNLNVKGKMLREEMMSALSGILI